MAGSNFRRYEFLGLWTSEEVREWMNRASAVCVTSVTRRSGEEEGFGMVCAEAQGVAKPIVAFNCEGISEVVCHGATRFLAEEGDWQTLAEYLLMLLRSRGFRAQFGQSGREWIVRQFDLEHCTKRLGGVYGAESESRMEGKRERISQPAKGSPSVSASPGH